MITEDAGAMGVAWDLETNGVRLTAEAEGGLKVSPRPVFFEELDLLRAGRWFAYPRCEAPLLWACGRRYFYRGEPVMRVEGGSLYRDPTVRILRGGLTLAPTDVEGMAARNRAALDALAEEAMGFISTLWANATAAGRARGVHAAELTACRRGAPRGSTVVRLGCGSFDAVLPAALQEAVARGEAVPQVDTVLCSFSAGKDSTVLLDLCARALPPDSFTVVYADTGYELPSSMELFERVKAKYPALRYVTVRNAQRVETLWDAMGIPSQRMRWCCTVQKTAPIYRALAAGRGGGAFALTFEGTRAAESARRSGYDRVGLSAKTWRSINARPLLRWRAVEVYLYLLAHGLPLNAAYRHGLARVGCAVCPHATQWSEFVVSRVYRAKMQPFEARLRAYAAAGGVEDAARYVDEGKWKLRCTGDRIAPLRDTYLLFTRRDGALRAEMANGRLPWDYFFGVLGRMRTVDGARGVMINGSWHAVASRRLDGGAQELTVTAAGGRAYPLVQRALYKATYCAACGACVAECPTGALRLGEGAGGVRLGVDAARCVHCHRCLTFHAYGCVAAESAHVSAAVGMRRAARLGQDVALKSDNIKKA